MSKHPTSPTAFSGLFSKKEKPEAWKWHDAPRKTEWGKDMVVASVAIDKDHTVDLYCERSQTAKVEEMFKQHAAQEPVAMRYDFDGYGWRYIDSGSGSNWQTRHKDAEPLYDRAQPREWKGLTTAELDEIDAPIREKGHATISEIYRAIEAKLREKNA